MNVYIFTDIVHMDEVWELLRQRLCWTCNQLEAGQCSLWDIQHSIQTILDMVVLSQSVLEQTNDSIEAAIRLLADALNKAENLAVQAHDEVPTVPSRAGGKRGRPAYSIPEDQLEYYLSQCFSTPQISSLIGVSESTIKRRLKEYGFRIRDTYSTLNDEELDGKIQSIIHGHPNIGCQSVKGHLLSQGERVQEYRIRDSLRRVDPAGVVLRRLCMRVIHRRSYSVPAPLSLWHIDGYHKLIR